MSQQRLREELRRAADAVSRSANAAHDDITNSYAHRGISDAQLQHVTRGLLEAAQKHLEVVRAAALQSIEVTGLPGLPVGQSNDEASREGRSALAGTWKSLAELETLRGDKDASIAAYRNAVELAPDDVTTHAQLADMLENRHHLAEARTHAERALRMDPANLVAALALARVFMRQEKFADAERAALTATETPRAIVDDRALAWALVGEARDRLDNTASAFKAFTQSNELMRRRYADTQERTHPAHPSNVRALTQFVERMDATAQRTPTTFGTPAPAFLIGFPRSGTTLLEQVLSSHSNITCLGETDHLFEAMSVVLKDGDLFERASALAADEIETVRAAYRRMVLRDHPAADGQIIVDKHPLHITLLPLIHKVFPDAKIILALRDPRDVVLSCYQQCFGINVATAQFLELPRAADYFDAVMTLTVTCRQKLKLDLHQVDYRNVVTDLENETPKMAAFLGVAFEHGMLDFNQHARTRTIASASARQVIDPIYDRSVGRWRRYARELAPVLPLLDKWARRLGYED